MIWRAGTVRVAPITWQTTCGQAVKIVAATCAESLFVVLRWAHCQCSKSKCFCTSSALCVHNLGDMQNSIVAPVKRRQNSEPSRNSDLRTTDHGLRHLVKKKSTPLRQILARMVNVLASGAAARALTHTIWQDGLALGHEFAQRFVDALVQGRGHIVTQHLLPLGIGAHYNVFRAIVLPLLK